MATEEPTLTDVDSVDEPILLTTSNRLEQWTKNEVRVVIRFLNARNISAAEIHRQLVDVYGENVMSRQSVAKWCSEFRRGRMRMENREKSGRPVTARTADNSATVENAIRDNAKITVNELRKELKLSHGTVVKIIQELGFTKVNGRWELRDEEKPKRSTRSRPTI